MDETQDSFKRIYVQLMSLRNNMGDKHPNERMEWDEVNIYNNCVGRLENLGFNLEDFKIPANMLTNQMVQGNYLTGEMVDTGNSDVRSGFFKTQLDSLLMYFEISGDDTQIGFHP
jgi:hypothetical protein